MELENRIDVWQESARSHGRKLMDMPVEMTEKEYREEWKEILEETSRDGNPRTFALRTKEYSEAWREALGRELLNFDVPENGIEDVARLISYDLRENMRKEGMRALEPERADGEGTLSPDDLGDSNWLYIYVNEFTKRDRIEMEPAILEELRENEAGWDEMEAYTFNDTAVYSEEWMDYKKGDSIDIDPEVEEYVRQIGIGL